MYKQMLKHVFIKFAFEKNLLKKTLSIDFNILKKFFISFLRIIFKRLM